MSKEEPKSDSYAGLGAAQTSKLGYDADRGCTDICMLIVHVLCWIGMFVLAGYAFKHGNPDRLFYGSDYLGNLCGKSSDTAPTKVIIPVDLMKANTILPSEFKTESWFNTKYVWYPIGMYQMKDPKTSQYKWQLFLKDAKDYGVCVSACPKSREAVFNYPNDALTETTGLAPSTAAATIIKGGKGFQYWTNYFDSNIKFHRCLPLFSDDGCESGDPNGPPKDVCKNSTSGKSSSVNEVAQAAEFFRQGYAELKAAYWVVILSVIFSIILAFAWLYSVRCTVKPLVVSTIILLGALVIGAGIGFIAYSNKLKTKGQVQDSKYFIVAAAMCFIAAFIYICVVFFLRNDIDAACDIIEEAAKVPAQIPTMSLVPPLFSLTLLPLLMFSLFTGVYIQSCGKRLDVNLELPKYLYLNGTMNSNITSKQLSFESWRVYAQIANLFMFLWGMEMMNAVVYLILAFCAVFWYWCAPGDDKVAGLESRNISPVKDGFLFTLKYHLGTVAFGSLLVSLITLFRILLKIFEKWAKKNAPKGTEELVGMVMKCAQCCLWCFEKLLNFVNKNAYIMTAMTGGSFCEGCRDAIRVLGAHAPLVMIINGVSAFIIAVGKVIVTVATGVSCWLIMIRSNLTGGQSSGGLPLLMILIVSFIIASLFCNVFDVCIDTITLCFCYEDENTTADAPKYCPKDLLDNLRKQSEAAAKERADNALSQPLTKA